MTEKEISEKILYGNEDPETVAQEVIDGKRPVGWNIPGHPDHATWVHLSAKKEEEKKKAAALKPIGAAWTLVNVFYKVLGAVIALVLITTYPTLGVLAIIGLLCYICKCCSHKEGGGNDG